MKKILLLLAAFIFSISAIFAQGNSWQKEAGESNASLANGYGGIELGMSVDEVKSALKKNPQFGYRGDRDVSLLPSTLETIIETDASRNTYSFLNRCYFQFHDEKLYIITINIKSSKMDYYSIFSTLCQKYGNPPSMNPKKAEWNDGKVLMSLEKPLTLKYTDNAVYEEIQNQSQVEKTAEEMTRDNFLNGL